jgi:TonB-linked SusC/RagA family outer membrane protein
MLHAAHAQLTIQGKIISLPDSSSLPGAVIKVKGSTQGTTADENGHFTLVSTLDTVRMQVSYIGYKAIDLSFDAATDLPVSIGLVRDENQLDEVVVSTGYQQIPKERAAGSFAFVDNALLNRRVSSDIVSRLDDVAAGLINNGGKGRARGLAIRGQATITSAASPLVVIDNFAYEGELSSINPNDIESITVLKDASAASIWGSRAGNGVIVITTKKGRKSKAPQISFNSNLTISGRPDLFYQPRMSTADFIDNELLLFQSGRYASAERHASQYPLTPVVVLLIAQRDGNISAEQAQSQIQALKANDIRKDYQKYLFQRQLSQQYALSVSGGTDAHRYFVSGGYDKTRPVEQANASERFSLNANNSFALGKRLEFSTGIYFSQSSATNNNIGPLTYVNPLTGAPGAAIYPYAQLAGPNGKSLQLIKDYRMAFTERARSQGLLDWGYNPLDEMALSDNSSKLTDYRINLTASYKILEGLSFSGLYQYGRGISQGRNHSSQQTYMARNLINQLSQVDSTGAVRRNLPLGGILDLTESAYTSQNLRGQLHFDRALSTATALTAFAGAEMRQLVTAGGTARYYGYDDEYASSIPVDYVTAFRSFVNPAATLRVPYADNRSGAADKYLSYFANASYTIKRRYLLTASARIDQSNLFGVKTNDKRVPLYSAGAAWTLSEEPFFKARWLAYLKLRATLGYSGNSNKTVSAFTTAYLESTDYYTRAPYAVITNPPNQDLRWEKVKTINLGADFELFGKMLWGSIEYYRKKGLDLIGSMPYPGSSGVKTFTGNYATTSGSGLDLTLTARLAKRHLSWQADLLLSRVTDKVTRYDIKTIATNYLGSGDGVSIYPLQGRPLYAVYSLRSAGLDAATGDPQGYLEGKVSKDYAAMLRIDPAQMTYHGPARPSVFGAFRNTVGWKGLSVSANISYRLGHYFRLGSVYYTGVNNSLLTHSDYGQRWQKPGDELHTSVPSRPATVNANRDNFYTYTEPLVQKAGNIRLQDVNLGYSLDGAWIQKLGLRTAQLYLYANHLTLLWKAYKGKLDPEYAQATFAPPRTLSIGLKADL